LNDGTVSGYLNRSIPNLITKDLQGASNEEINNKDILSAF